MGSAHPKIAASTRNKRIYMLFSPSVFIDCYCCFHARNIHDSSKEVKHFLQISLKYLTQTRHLKSCVYLRIQTDVILIWDYRRTLIMCYNHHVWECHEAQCSEPASKAQLKMIFDSDTLFSTVFMNKPLILCGDYTRVRSLIAHPHS